MHVVGHGLGIALTMGRVFVINPEGPYVTDSVHDLRWQTNNTFCHSQGTGSSTSNSTSSSSGSGTRSLECYFEPWTQCTWEEVIHGEYLTSPTEMRKNGTYYLSDTTIGTQQLWQLPQRVILLEHRADVSQLVPPVLTSLLRCSAVHTHHFFYVWRAFSTAYLLRPNKATLKFFEEYRQSHQQQPYPSYPHSSLSSTDMSTLIPSSTSSSSSSSTTTATRQCVSVYVRVGDKHVEVHRLPPLSRYFAAVQYLWRHGHIDGVTHLSSSSSSSLSSSSSSTSTTTTTTTESKKNGQGERGEVEEEGGVMFIGSEDMPSITTAVTWGNIHHWSIHYTTLFNRSSLSAALSWDQQTPLRQHGTMVHHEYEYLSMLLNIDYHLHCNGFVCMMASNFCRVLEELKSTVAGKAQAHFVDVTNDCGEEGDGEGVERCMDKNFMLGWRL